ncbi:2TM domain-containing protein [Winogradskyella tangerina]|uniref:2TM domain-containing protein n=1 Tax=Winogradskyella tangerina TaxID=2023240 RepID=UPI000DBE250A|nr:2TM domain-containing protein [Winogradskyella tangerina]
MKNKNQNLKYIKAKNKVERERGFYTHLIIYFLVNVMITILKLWNDLDSWESFTNELISINVLSVWCIWGVFLVLHFISFKFGGAWEERKIEELMNKELYNDSKR